MKRILPVLATLLTLVLALSLNLFARQEKKPAEGKQDPAAAEHKVFKMPAEAAETENPIKPTAASIAEGKHLFESQCAMCHGKTGDGKGDLSVEMKFPTKDWRKPETLKKWADGELFYILEMGKDPMPGQEGRMKDEQKWHLVNFIRSLAQPETVKAKE